MGDRYGFDLGMEDRRFLNLIVYESYDPMGFEKNRGRVDGIRDYRKGALWWRLGDYEVCSHLSDL